MKELLFIISFIFCINISKSFAQVDPVYLSIAQLNLNHYAGLPVDSFLNKIPQSYDYIQLYGVLKDNKVGGLRIGYPGGIIISIRPIHYSFMNPIDSNGVWNLGLFKKETANFIIVGHPEHPTLTGQVMTAVEN